MVWDLAYIDEPQEATCDFCGTDASELQCIICDKEFKERIVKALNKRLEGA